MDNLQGKLLFAFVVATLAACGLAWLLARRYRKALVALMRAPEPAAPAPTDLGLATTLSVAQATSALPSGPTPALPSLPAWQRTEWRLIAALVALSLLIALTRGAITHLQVIDGPFSVPRMLLLSALFAWPVLAAVALMRRWSNARLALALLLWYAVGVALAMARSNAAQSLVTVMQFLAFEMAPAALALLALTARRTRACAPWLWPPLALLVLAAIASLDGLSWLVDRRSTLLAPLLTLPPLLGIALVAALGVALAWWPVGRLARWLARAYAQRRVSDLAVLFIAAWTLALAFDALASGPRVLLPLLWIPLALVLAQQWQRRRHQSRAPTLLVLRVFKQDANVTALFDDVVERWRVVGNTVLIAGTDLVDHTLDAADLFDFLDGRLAQRFVHSAADVPRRLAAFDWTPDADGRFRVNECYCHDSGWQVALVALVQRADVVLMDLRGFQAHNAGCRFELGVLARAAALQRVVVLADASTDRAVARADAAAAPAGRFAWIEVPPQFSRHETARRVRAALAGGGDRSPRVTRPAALPS